MIAGHAPLELHRRVLVYGIVTAILATLFSPARFPEMAGVSPPARGELPVKPPPGSDRKLAALVSLLQHSGRGDALIVNGTRLTAIGAMGGVRAAAFAPIAHANVVSEWDGRRVALPSLASSVRAGALVTTTGIAMREFARAGSHAAAASFVVPCATTFLAPGQFGFVYLGSFTRSPLGALQLTEIGLQMNPPPGGGVPTSVQLYARRATGAGTTVASPDLHLRCDAPLNVRFETIGSYALAATFDGRAISLSSHRVTIVERLDDGERTASSGCRRCAIERVTALAVPQGSPVERRGTRLGLSATGSSPLFAYTSDNDFVETQISRRPPVLSSYESARTLVAIDERNAT